jgi:hypothetical protein
MLLISVFAWHFQFCVAGLDMFLLIIVLSILQFGIFAAGLENLLGEEVEPGQEDVEATAGISLDLIDVSLRPISFFHGQSGLMGAVWSAPSEPTSALQVMREDGFSGVLRRRGADHRWWDVVLC